MLIAALKAQVGGTESYWYAQASDYEAKYSFCGPDVYDRALKRRYYARAEVCRIADERIPKAWSSTDPKEIREFMDLARSARKELHSIGMDAPQMKKLSEKLHELEAACELLGE